MKFARHAGQRLPAGVATSGLLISSGRSPHWTDLADPINGSAPFCPMRKTKRNSSSYEDIANAYFYESACIARAGMTALQDLTGQRFNLLTVIDRDESSRAGKARWICKCDCGNETSVIGSNLKNGNVKSCGCQRMSPDKLPKGSVAEIERTRELALFTEHFQTVGLDALPEGLLPKRQKGRQSARAEALYNLQVARFCDRMRQIRSTMDFEVGSRGWCYILEEIGLGKGDFAAAQSFISGARKSGLLPIDICAPDESREVTFWEELTDETSEEHAQDWIDTLSKAHERYTPISFWDYQDYYLEVVVEKIDLKTLFSPVCEEYRVPIANACGWVDINQRAGIMQRFKRWEDAGKQCILLYCGDHDPAGLNISDSFMALFEEMQGAVGWNPGRLIIDRFGLNADFINANGLTWIDNLETSSGGNLADERHPDHKKPYVQEYLKRFGAQKVEANALVVRPQQGRQLCRDAITKYIDPHGIVAYEDALADAREEARQAIADKTGDGEAA
jgi:hypothetical protein